MRLFIDELTQTFRLADAVDIAIVAMFVHALLSWVRVRHARSIAIPVVVGVAVYWLARWLDLYLTAAIFQYGLFGALFVFVLVFQQDIRREFERLATWTSSRQPPAFSDSLTNSIVEAIAYLTKRKIGALLLLRGNEPIDRHVNGGVIVNAECSFPLLCSIFHPDSPGHDGAVVLAGDRIEKLGLHLPLSSDHSQLSGRGTRHAAGLGITERCDSMAIVVSEERGTVAIADNGRLRQVQSDELTEELHSHFKDLEAQRSSRRKGQSRIGALCQPLVAVLFAALLWFGFAFETETIQKTMVLPIEYRGLAENLIVEHSGFSHAQITLHGTEPEFASLDPAKVAVSLDLNDASSGEQLHELSADSIKNLPEGLRVVELQPRRVRISVRASLPPDPAENSKLSQPETDR